jgi:hypothetical protein
MNWKGYGRKWSWCNLRCYPGICLEKLSKTTKSKVPSRYLRSKALDSHFRGVRFKSRLCWLIFFFIPSRLIPELLSGIGHHRFLPKPIQYLIHLSPVRPYTEYLLKALLISHPPKMLVGFPTEISTRHVPNILHYRWVHSPLSLPLRVDAVKFPLPEMCLSVCLS